MCGKIFKAKNKARKYCPECKLVKKKQQDKVLMKIKNSKKRYADKEYAKAIKKKQTEQSDAKMLGVPLQYIPSYHKTNGAAKQAAFNFDDFDLME